MSDPCGTMTLLTKGKNMDCNCVICHAFFEDFAPEFGPDSLPFEK